MNATTDESTGIGLSDAEAARRLRADGSNTLPRPGVWQAVRRLFEPVREPMFLMLLGAAVVYLAIGNITDATVLGAFATFSVSIALVQRGRSERALRALRDLSAPKASVRRSGRILRIPGAEVVRDDLLVLQEGDRVAADGMLISADALLADESLLTGESMPVSKSAGGEVFAGTLVVRGGGLARVVATGASSRMGEIGSRLSGIKEVPAGVQAETRHLVRVFAIAAIVLLVMAMLLHYRTAGDWPQALLAGIALAMTMLPEEFPLVLTVFTVMGARRLSTARVLARRPAAIEALGAATVLCTDKTGTLTQNRMTLVHLASRGATWSAGDAITPLAQDGGALRELLDAALCATAADSRDPLDRAVHALAESVSLGWPARDRHVRLFPWRAEVPVVAQVWRQSADSLRVSVKGAPETVVAWCGLDDDGRESLLQDVRLLAERGIRVLAVAVGEATGQEVQALASLRYRFVGLLGFIDPLRPSARASVMACRGAGLRVVMLTGDHPVTAASIAADAGIAAGDTLLGADVDRMDARELARSLRTTSVVARVRPEQKLRIVEALRSDGQIVAMTGDGVNDAPALRAAHIGVAMGGRGTDVASEAASIVLLDDDLGAMVRALGLGRRIYDNLKKASGYILSVHVPIAGIALLPLVLGQPMILTPMIIALMELLIDPACSLVFESEAAEDDVLRRPPRDPRARIFDLRQVTVSVAQGLLALAAVSGVYLWMQARGDSIEDCRAATLFMLIGANVCLILANRSSASGFKALVARGNRMLAWGVGLPLAIVTLLFAVPYARSLSGIALPAGADVVAWCAVLVVLLWALQTSKALVRSIT